MTSPKAEIYPCNNGDAVIGSIQTYNVKGEESLIEIARKFDLGYNEIVRANPGVDPFIPGNGVPVQIPTSWILPNVTSYSGIVINLSEMRLYYFLREKEANGVMTFPIGIGREGYDTPSGDFNIIQKIVNPNWVVPASILKEKMQLPKVVPAGRDNPLGSYALRLSSGSILIHGTNKPWGVGRKVSYGCIRLYPEDISQLFKAVSNGTRVKIVRQPIKTGIKDGKIYVEIHNDDNENSSDNFAKALRYLTKANLLEKVNKEKIYNAIIEKSEFPVEITK